MLANLKVPKDMSRQDLSDATVRCGLAPSAFAVGMGRKVVDAGEPFIQRSAEHAWFKDGDELSQPHSFFSNISIFSTFSAQADGERRGARSYLREALERSQ